MSKDDRMEWKEKLTTYNETPFKNGVTPRRSIWKKNKATLWYYPAAKKNFHIPVFIIYSLINQPFILDLAKGRSTIEALVEEGFDVYLIDFGKPGLEDKDLNLEDYIVSYIEAGVQQALKHSKAEEITIMGYCLGGTLASIYTAIAKEPIKNLILFVTPIDFAESPYFNVWIDAMRSEQSSYESYLKEIGILPASYVEAGVRLVTSPVYFTPYLSLLHKANDPAYLEKWHRFNTWARGHIPLSGAVAEQLRNDLVKENKLIKGLFTVKGRKAELANIHANLLIVATKGDRLVPEAQILPIMDAVSSQDKYYQALSGGHTGTSVKDGKLAPYLEEWLVPRSMS